MATSASANGSNNDDDQKEERRKMTVYEWRLKVLLTCTSPSCVYISGCFTCCFCCFCCSCFYGNRCYDSCVRCCLDHWFAFFCGELEEPDAPFE